MSTLDLDGHFLRALSELDPTPAQRPGGPASARAAHPLLLAYAVAQFRSRHLDLAARVLQAQGEGFYTIASSGHESNAALGLVTGVGDPALLHYRSGALYCARVAAAGFDPVCDILASLMCSTEDPISGGRHKVFGRREAGIIPQTSTIASHLPRAVGLAFALERARRLGRATPYPNDAIVLASLGDASLNHASAAAALNTAGHTVHQGLPLPLLLVVEDNGIGISVRTPSGWTASRLRATPGLRYACADGSDALGTLAAAREVTSWVRANRRPAVLHLRTVRYLGHAGSDAEMAYRSPAEIADDLPRDPLLGTARALVAQGVCTPAEVLDLYEEARAEVARTAVALRPVRRLASAAEVMAPLTRLDAAAGSPSAVRAADAQARRRAHGGTLPEEAGPLTLSLSLGAALTDLLAADDGALVFGEDVGAKGGVYGVTRGLQRRFGRLRVFDTLLDETSVLGTALGAALAGFLPVPEIQYLAYLHNAEDQLRGEAATLAFFSDGRYRNGLVVRVQGLAYQRGFGGHFHNDNALAVLRDIPGLVVAVPASAAEAPGLLRALAGAARGEGTVGVLLEPIALYHSRDLYADGDGLRLARYAPPGSWARTTPRIGEVRVHRAGQSRGHSLAVTFGNGVGMTQRALAHHGIAGVDVLDLRWVVPIPARELRAEAAHYDRIVVVDETRAAAGVSEGVITALVDAGWRGRLSRVTSADSVIPLGPAAATVLLSEDDIAQAFAAEES